MTIEIFSFLNEEQPLALVAVRLGHVGESEWVATLPGALMPKKAET